MKLFTLDFMNIYYDEKLRLIEYKWKKNSETITDSQYKETISELIKIIKTFEPFYILGNIKDQYYSPTADTQKWLAEHAIEKIPELGIKKLAIINSKYFMVKNIYKNLIHDKDNIRIFENGQDAISWLLDNVKNVIE